MIITTREGHAVESRAFALTDMVRWGYNGLRNLQTQVGDREAHGVPALHRAARLRAEAVADLKLYCWRGEGAERQKVTSVWQSRLFSNGPQANATNPQQTRFSFWETVEESLAWYSDAYIWKNVADGRITDWWALHPAQVLPKFEGTQAYYEVQVAPGYVDPVGRGPGRYRVDSSTILHIRGFGQGGRVNADPVNTVFRDYMAAVLGRQRHEARMWRRGTALQVAIEFPQGVSKEQADQWRESWRSNYEGTEGETTAVIGGGGQIKPIGMSLADAAFVELAHLTVEDAARIMAVPANLLGAQITHPRPDLEQDLMAWLRFGLGPELGRIEDALYADPDLFGGSQTYPAFDTETFVRGDILTEATVLISSVQAGIRTPDEARRVLGLEELPDGVGAIPQITPVGGAANPSLLPAPKLAPGGKKAPIDNADEAKALTIPSLELRVDQDMAPVADAVTDAFDQQTRVLAGMLIAMREENQRRAELETTRETRALRQSEQRELETTAFTQALERVGAPNVTVNVEPTPVTVENTVVVPENQLQLTLIDDDAPMEIDFKRGANGAIQSATVK